jgi:hypothetical protein
MDEPTAYVRMHVINYEPSWLALHDAATRYRDDILTLAQASELVAAATGKHRAAMGLKPKHLTGDIGYADMVELEASEL